MKIPAFLESSYQSDHKLAGFAASALSVISGHVAASRMEFFPEYTDHGIVHLELVLQTAFDLATGPARGLMTSTDAAILVVAVGLHDFGMHLTRDGFESLIAPDCRWRGTEFFDRQSWSTLWEDFYAEATRFDGRQLRLLFGAKYRAVRPLPPGGAPWEDFDYLLVGEFIRRHHPRLAHDIALFGFPAKEGNFIQVCPDVSDEGLFLADTAGLIARSHGIDLRSCLTYLEQKYQNKVDPRRAHVAFLGVLLRIADYFQIQPTRAPKERTETTRFKSQLSDREWKVHQSIEDIHNTSTDPEAIVVVASPKDVRTFLRLKDWLDGLQSELDRSWAILGEVYGLQTHNSLNLLGLKVRRVKSNLDDLSSFTKTVSYVPAKIAFEAANADLLTLLVAPLYSNDPGVGIRELIQNAVDAVREFNDSASRHPHFASIERYPLSADVLLDIQVDTKNNPLEITVTDRGIGMTVDVVRNYFLKAGASFRRSTVWRQEHEDDSGHSRILRTGRFGIGALAAFLLGDEIEVTTRSAFLSPDEGITFKASLDDDTISLGRTTCPAGTCIRIRVPERMRQHVARVVPDRNAKSIPFGSGIGHYFLRAPSLVRHISDRADIPVSGWLPQPDDDISADWRRFVDSHFDFVYWTYDTKYPALSCNGIVIGNYRGGTTLWSYVSTPQVSVFDRDGRLPINLQRNGLQGSLPFKDQLTRSVAEDLLAHGIVEAPNKWDQRWFSGLYEGFSREYIHNVDGWARWFAGRHGFVFNEANLLADFNAQYFVSILGVEAYEKWNGSLRSLLPEDALLTCRHPSVFDDNNPRIKGFFQNAIRGSFAPPCARVRGYACYLSLGLIQKVSQLNPGRSVRTDLSMVGKLEQQGNWRVFERNFALPAWCHELVLALGAEKDISLIVSIFKVEAWDVSGGCKLLRDRWTELAETPLIPWEVSKRRALEGYVSRGADRLLQVRRERATAAKAKKATAAEVLA